MFFKNSALLLAFLLKADGVFFFFFFAFEIKAPFPLVSKRKEKLFPRDKAKEKVSDLLYNVWHKSRHCEKSAAFSLFTEVIFTDYI